MSSWYINSKHTRYASFRYIWKNDSHNLTYNPPSFSAAFSVTYSCEEGFSAVLEIKTKVRIRMNFDAALRPAKTTLHSRKYCGGEAAACLTLTYGRRGHWILSQRAKSDNKLRVFVIKDKWKTKANDQGSDRFAFCLPVRSVKGSFFHRPVRVKSLKTTAVGE